MSGTGGREVWLKYLKNDNYIKYVGVVFMKKLAIQLFEYHSCANEQIIQHLGRLPEEIFTNKVESVFPTIAETCGHMIAVDELWYLRLKGENLRWSWVVFLPSQGWLWARWALMR